MSKLILYADLSPSRPWIFATIHANRTLMLNCGLYFAPQKLWTSELIPSNTIFEKVPEKKHYIPTGIAKRMTELSQQLDSGHDTLFINYSAYLPSYQFFSNLIRKYINLNKHTYSIIFTIGRPVCTFEQRWRQSMHSLTDSEGHKNYKSFSCISSIIKNACQEWGENRVTLLTDLSDSPVANSRSELIKQLFDIFGCPSPYELEHLPRHPLFLASHEARRLSWTLEVRNNSWPRLDETQFMDCLRNVERDWGTSPLSPKKLRQMLIHEGAEDQGALEALLHLPPGSLDCPEWLATQPEADFYTPLSEEKVRAFASDLPPAVRSPLRQRFINDAHLLSEDQKALSKALAAVEAVHIGEPVPPVELTVLTMTYNHEAYIAECMDSVLAQKTNFPIRHLVLDHCSTDGTADIVSAYAARHPSIQPVLLSCHRRAENAMGLFERCRTTYAALCDGDDYFTEPLKLQKQVDFLQTHPDCALCFHPVAVVFENGEQPDVFPPIAMLPRGLRNEYYLADLMRCNMIQSNSIVYRWRFKEGIPKWFRPGLCPGDWYWHLLHAEMGKIGFLPEVMSVYRRHKNALYKDSFIDQVKHRRIFGMEELAVYQAINEHFHNRYFRRMSSLANGVFAIFLEIYLHEHDDSLLIQACDAFPQFAQHFLNDLKLMQKENMSCV